MLCQRDMGHHRTSGDDVRGPVTVTSRGVRRPWPYSATLAALIAATPATAMAQEASSAELSQDGQLRTAARHLALEGAELFENGEYDSAQDRFDRAYSLYAAPTLAYWSGRSLEQMDRWLLAEERYVTAAKWKLDQNSSEAFRDAAQGAQQALERLRQLMPMVRLLAEGPMLSTYKVFVDGHAIPAALLGVHQPMDPGAHRVEVRAGSATIAQHEITVDSGGRQDLILALPGTREPPAAAVQATSSPATKDAAEPPPPPAPDEVNPPLPWRLPAMIGSFGVGGIGLGMGIWYGIKAVNQHSELSEELCNDARQCPASDVDAFRASSRISTVGYIVGGLGLAAGTGLLLFTQEAQDASADGRTLQAWLGFGEAGISGSF